MRRFMILAAACALCTTAACTPATTGGGGGLEPAVGTVVLTGTKAFALAEIAYTGAAQTALAATNAGLITGERATQLRDLNARATELLQKGYAAANDVDKARLATELLDVVERIRGITGR